MNLFLCGMPGCGKSTIGALLAKQLSLSFLDTDRLIEEHYHVQYGLKVNCREMTIKEGVLFFRSLEERIVKNLSEQENVIVALGGGTLLSEVNTQFLRSLGQMIYLKTATQDLLPRILRRGIPTYLDKDHPEESLIKLAHERESLYAASSDHTVDTSGMTPEEVAHSLTILLQNGF